jgi:hypothetical protein
MNKNIYPQITQISQIFFFLCVFARSLFLRRPEMTINKKVEIEEKLAQTRTDLLTFLQALDEPQWETAVQTEDAVWTIADLVRHLVNAESGMTTLMEKFKIGEDPVPPDFDRDRFNQSRVRKTQDLSPAQLMTQMSENRAKLLSFIDTLAPEDWQKKGRHASLRIMTNAEVCNLNADHDSWHLIEMKKVINEDE